MTHHNTLSCNSAAYAFAFANFSWANTTCWASFLRTFWADSLFWWAIKAWFSFSLTDFWAYKTSSLAALTCCWARKTSCAAAFAAAMTFVKSCSDGTKRFCLKLEKIARNFKWILMKNLSPISNWRSNWTEFQRRCPSVVAQRISVIVNATLCTFFLLKALRVCQTSQGNKWNLQGSFNNFQLKLYPNSYQSDELHCDLIDDDKTTDFKLIKSLLFIQSKDSFSDKIVLSFSIFPFVRLWLSIIDLSWVRD